ncbi:hypothetical protein DPMN_010869 [Dreissena polymorpha]|uniref:Uncharacterized protein n=1 Tax=Dreissena polymorpha TaxID=45954 RepID=A0A9D4N311_DREPO|nr:hypothetical protein DPMN_010869 [Dreissena polymorpha]
MSSKEALNTVTDVEQRSPEHQHFHRLQKAVKQVFLNTNSYMEFFYKSIASNASGCHEGGCTKPSTMTSAMAKEHYDD